jgi:hypothetical protein
MKKRDNATRRAVRIQQHNITVLFKRFKDAGQPSLRWHVFYDDFGDIQIQCKAGDYRASLSIPGPETPAMFGPCNESRSTPTSAMGLTTFGRQKTKTLIKRFAEMMGTAMEIPRT